MIASERVPRSVTAARPSVAAGVNDTSDVHTGSSGASAVVDRRLDVDVRRGRASRSAATIRPVVTSSTPASTRRWQRRCWRVWIMASGHTWAKHSTVRFAAIGG